MKLLQKIRKKYWSLLSPNTLLALLLITNTVACEACLPTTDDTGQDDSGKIAICTDKDTLQGNEKEGELSFKLTGEASQVAKLANFNLAIQVSATNGSGKINYTANGASKALNVGEEIKESLAAILSTKADGLLTVDELLTTKFTFAPDPATAGMTATFQLIDTTDQDKNISKVTVTWSNDAKLEISAITRNFQTMDVLVTIKNTGESNLKANAAALNWDTGNDEILIDNKRNDKVVIPEILPGKQCELALTNVKFNNPEAKATLQLKVIWANSKQEITKKELDLALNSHVVKIFQFRKEAESLLNKDLPDALKKEPFDGNQSKLVQGYLKQIKQLQEKALTEFNTAGNDASNELKSSVVDKGFKEIFVKAGELSVQAMSTLVIQKTIQKNQIAQKALVTLEAELKKPALESETINKVLKEVEEAEKADENAYTYLTNIRTASNLKNYEEKKKHKQDPIFQNKEAAEAQTAFEKAEKQAYDAAEATVVRYKTEVEKTLQDMKDAIQISSSEAARTALTQAHQKAKNAQVIIDYWDHEDIKNAANATIKAANEAQAAYNNKFSKNP